MITLRSWGGIFLGCMLALALTQDLLANPGILPIGRRRAAARETTTSRDNAPASRPATTAVPNKQEAPAVGPKAEADVQAGADEQIDPLLQLAERAITRTSQRYLDADNHTPWQIIHGLLALRRDFVLTRGDAKINCIEFLSNGPTFRGEPWWQVTEHGGRAHPFSVPYAFEGHVNQTLALLSMSDLPLTHEFRVDGVRTLTMADMVENARMTVNTREEITWTLWFLTHYVDIDDEWTNAAGQPWSMEELVRVQTASPVINTPCGGCHGLFAIAYARNAYLQKHGRLRGVYFQAEQKLNKYIELARTMQNHDGSFSTEFFKGTGQSRDFNERLKSSGHMLEWLMMALPEERLNEPWVRKAVASISTDLILNASQPAECGPLYHALNSLIMYRDRARGPQTPIEESLELADTPRQNGDATAGDPMALPVVEPDAFASPKRTTTSVAIEPNKSATRDTPVAETIAEPQFEPTPLVEAQPDSAEELARKAAQRLVGKIRKPTSIVEPQRLADEQEPPGLLRAPGSDPPQTAAEPSEATIR
jgi:hypothetical protein